MKKTVIILILMLTAFGFVSCTSTNEYKLKDNLLASSETDDLYNVYYEIFVSSFSDSNEDGYGDLQGLINRLDYLNDGSDNSGYSLGVEGLWLMPIMPSPSYHKYDVMDYKDIDPAYGTLEDFEALINETDKRGVDVIIDLVLNHTSSQHPWFLEAREAVEDGDFDNKYIDYYTLVTRDEKISGRTYYYFAGDYYYEGNFSSQMPELNMDNPDVLAEIVDILEFWYDLGVKGFRLDATKYVYYGDTAKNLDFWEWFVTEAKKIKPDTYIVGETWSADSLIAPYYANFSNFDFGMSQQQGMVSATLSGLYNVNEFVGYLGQYRQMIEDINESAILTPFISNHDNNRSAGYLPVSTYAMHCAANMYILSYGNPFIYYGEEIGMKGSRGAENTDANRRLAMLWGDGDTVVDPVGTTYDPESQINGTVLEQIEDENSLYNHYKKLIMLRKANPEIARGDYTLLNFDGYTTFGGFLSTYEESTVGVFHNIGFGELTIDLSQYTDYSFTELRGYVGQGVATLDGQLLTIAPYTSVVLK